MQKSSHGFNKIKFWRKTTNYYSNYLFFILHGPTVPFKWTFLKENSLFMLLKFALNARNLKIVLFWYSQYKFILPLLQLWVTDSLGQKSEWLRDIFERNCIFVANGHIKMVFLNYKKPCQIVQWVSVTIIFKLTIVYLSKYFSWYQVVLFIYLIISWNRCSFIEYS